VSAGSLGGAGLQAGSWIAVLISQFDDDFVRQGKPFTDSNDPRLLARYRKHVSHVSLESGFAERLEAFETKAAAFPNPPSIVIAT
jgi:hypothetical protein